MRKLIPVVFVFMIFIGCASAQKNSIVSYKVVGIALEHGGSVAKGLVRDGIVSAEEGERLKAQYMQARSAYISAGDILKAMLESEDFRERKEYEKYIIEVAEILTQIEAVIEKHKGGTWE